MEKVKKYLNVICLGVAALFSVLMFATMAGAGAVAGDDGTSCYELMKGDYKVGGVIVAMVFGIIAFVVAAALLVMSVLNLNTPVNKYFKWIALAGAVFALVSCILFFCTKGMANSVLDKTFKGWVDYEKIGAGAVFSAIFQMLAFFGLCFYGIKDYIIKD